MKNYRKHIDDFFREKLGNYTETPPPEVWEDLEKRLDVLTPWTPASPYRWMWHVAIVSVLLVLGVSVGRKIAGNTSNNYMAVNSPAISKTNETPVTGTKAVASANTNEPAQATVNEQNTGNNTATASSNTPANNQNASNYQSSSSANQTNNNNSLSQKQVQHNKYPGAAKKTTPAVTGNGKNSYAGANSRRNGNPAPEEENTNENNQSSTVTPNASPAGNTKTTIADNEKKTDPAATKKANVTNAKTNAAIKDDKRSAIGFNRFEAGVKMGYEGGFSDGAASKFVVSPYLQYNMSSKFSLMIQPAVKAAYVSNKSIGSPQSYYKVNEDGNITEDWDHTSSSIVGGTVQTTHTTQYTYTQTHDSIVKSNTFGGTYTEVELPILLKYAITKKVSVYGGVNLVYSRLMGVTEHTYTQQGILKTLVDTVITVNATPQPPKTGITYTGTPYANYSPAYPGMPESQLRIGYMLGFSYAYRKKWLFDALMEQTPAASDVKGSYNINTPLSSAYFRLSVGYKLSK